jgi:hypothetical protein
MSLNRYESALFAYWEKQPDERRHWQAKIADITRGTGQPGELARALDRELWDYLAERRQHVPALQAEAGELSRVSLLNLAEYIIRLWGPPPKPKKTASSPG